MVIMTPEQLTALVAALATLATAVAGLLGAVGVLWVKIDRNQHAVDGRLNELIATSRVAGHAEGVALAHALSHPDEQPTTEP